MPWLYRAIVVALCAAAGVVAAGCLTTQGRVMESWEGKTVAELVTRWGAPDAAVDLGDGRQVLTWRSLAGDGAGTVSTCRRSFTVGPGGTIERWSYSGCPVIVLELL